MNASPTQWHQVIAGNMVLLLMAHKTAINGSWIPMIGVGTRVPVSPRSLPQPDVYVQEGAPQDSSVTTDALILFEVLSKSNTGGDQAWRKRVYASVPNCQHYVTVATKSAECVRCDRADGWTGNHKVNGLDGVLELPAVAARLSLRDIYRWTPIT
jgi:Uma2 family endonuclease